MAPCRSESRRISPPARWTIPPLLLLVAGLVGSPAAEAQSDFPITIAAGAHALTVPWYPQPVASGFNPAFLLGTDGGLGPGGGWQLYYAINLGFFRHRWWMTGLSLDGELGLRRSLPAGFHADLRLGLGYLHYFWRRKTMKLVDGRYVAAANLGKPSLLIPLSLTVGYRGDPENPIAVQPFVTARWGAQGLFTEDVPVATHLLLLGGVRIERGRTGTGGN